MSRDGLRQGRVPVMLTALGTIALGCGGPSAAPPRVGTRHVQPDGSGGAAWLAELSRLPTVEPGCVEGDAWRPVTDARRQAAALAAAAPLFRADQAGGALGPTACRLRVSTRCAPDVRSDGQPELLVAFHWSIPIDGGMAGCDHLDPDDPAVAWPAYAVVMVTPTATEWRPLGVVAVAIEDGQTSARTSVGRFVQLGRAIGVEVMRSWAASETGCELARASIVGVVDGELRELVTRDAPADCE